LRHLRKAIVPMGELRLWAAAFGGVKALENALIDRVLHDLFEADIRTKEGFELHSEKIKSQILPLGQVVVHMAGLTLKGLYDATEILRALEMASLDNKSVLTFLAELRQELTCLVPKDFLIRFGKERLIHIVRYLHALAIRARKGVLHLEKALERGKEISEISLWHKETTQNLTPYATEEKRQALDDFRWMIEEYKVSLFAQELKTALPVSRKRIEARMEDIQRML
jgi:ATP-dependent helicase HrpA